MKLATLTGCVLLLTAGYAAAQSMTANQCAEVWIKAAPKDGKLAEKDAAPYIVDFKSADSDHDGTISLDEFKAACANGLIKYTKP